MTAVSARYVKRMLEASTRATGRVVGKELRELRMRVDALERDQRDSKFCGVWQRAADYKRSNFATHDGSLWVALRDCSGSKPGDDPADWQLCVKREVR